MKPTAIILDLLRTYRRRGTSVRTIMATGAMFDLSENVMRVSLSRLVARGMVENIQRGHYRLADRADPLSDFVERWRQGENRLRAWDGDAFLLMHTATAADSRRDWALNAHGFRQVTTGLWARPDNLAGNADELERLLCQLGVDRESVLVSNARIAPRWQAAWLAHFDIAAMLAIYREHERKLAASLGRLDDLRHEAALKETFHLGGRAVHILAKDPLLPAQIIDPAPRRALWQTMLAYDRKGREIWGRRGESRPEVMPTPQLQVATI